MRNTARSGGNEQLREGSEEKCCAKAETIPLDEDIRTLSLRVEGLYAEYISNLKTTPCKTYFEKLNTLVIVDIILLCRRRPRDILWSTLHFYSQLTNNNGQDVEFLTSEEKQSGDELEIFYVPGKNDTKVPILITKGFLFPLWGPLLILPLCV